MFALFHFCSIFPHSALPSVCFWSKKSGMKQTGRTYGLCEPAAQRRGVYGRCSCTNQERSFPLLNHRGTIEKKNLETKANHSNNYKRKIKDNKKCFQSRNCPQTLLQSALWFMGRAADAVCIGGLVTVYSKAGADLIHKPTSIPTGRRCSIENNKKHTGCTAPRPTRLTAKCQIKWDS